MNARQQAISEAKYLGVSRDEVLDIFDEKISEWHNSNTKSSVQEYLGLSEIEYAYFIEQPYSFANALIVMVQGGYKYE